MNSNVAHLFIMVFIIAAAGAATIVFLVARTHLARTRLLRAQWQERDMRAGEWRESYRALRDANDAAIVELDTHPATYDLFPAQVRGLLDSAHDRARELEAREGLSHR